VEVKAETPRPSDTPLKEGNEHPHSPSKKGWQANPDGVVADTPLKEGNKRYGSLNIFILANYSISGKIIEEPNHIERVRGEEHAVCFTQTPL